MQLQALHSGFQSWEQSHTFNTTTGVFFCFRFVMCYGISSTAKTPSAGVVMRLYVKRGPMLRRQQSSLTNTRWSQEQLAAECESRLIFIAWYQVLAKRFQTNCTGRSFPNRFRISSNVQQKLRPACAHLPYRYRTIYAYKASCSYLDQSAHS